jgi:glycosyltransferase 2 family protein
LKAFAKRLIGSRWTKIAVVVIAVAIGVYEIAREWRDVHQALGQIGLLAAFEALLVLLVMQFATLLQWQSLLAGLGSPIKTTAAGRIFFIGQLGKYIPGSVWPILTQMELGARAGVPRVRSATASLLTMIVSLAGGLLVAAAAIPFAHYNRDYDLVFILVPVILACLCPPVLNPLLGLLFKITKRQPLDQPVTLAMVAKSLGWSLVAWLANGVQIWILADKLGAPAGRTFAIALGGYAFAWCVGFVAIFDPAGAGIREALLVYALAPVLPVVGLPLAVALVSRAVNTVSDLLVAGAAAASRRRLNGVDGGAGENAGTAGKDQPPAPAAEAIIPVTSGTDATS